VSRRPWKLAGYRVDDDACDLIVARRTTSRPSAYP
jgi:hypothetical protein